MRCKQCANIMSVIDTRNRYDGRKRRRHLCKTCNINLTTLEVEISELRLLSDTLWKLYPVIEWLASEEIQSKAVKGIDIKKLIDMPLFKYLYEIKRAPKLGKE